MTETPHRYTAELADQIEVAWQDRWEQEGTFHAPNPAGPWADPEAVAAYEGKLLVLDMFPYPSGAGLHVGHPLGYIATDVFGRYNRMLGKNVLHCLGYDAFGLPAEQYAVQTGQHPRKTTEDNIVIMTRQLRRLGLAHDNRRALRTMDPEYYKWTQWIFLQIFNSWYDVEAVRADGGLGKARPIAELIAQFESGERPTPSGVPWTQLSSVEQHAILDSYRLAYTSQAPVNWAPGLGTVLSNEEVTNDGRSERGNFPVYRKNLRQWMMRITAYADRLADDLDRVDWPEKVKLMQRNWIGRSQGARVTFPVDGSDQGIEVFTTRPDTIFGATFMVLAPEHPLLDSIVPEGNWEPGANPKWTADAMGPAEAVAAYRRSASRKSEVERQLEGKDKTGVFTGAFAINPATGVRIPVFVADYVLMGYGTGAIMAVPAQDERDWDFATAYALPIVRTVQPADGHDEATAFTGDGVAINSANDEVDLNGLNVAEAKARIIDWLQDKGFGRGTINYRLRDWLFSRQRYWGEPFPIVFDAEGNSHAIPESMLPLALPEIPDYRPRTFEPNDDSSEPEPPLGRAQEWVNVELDLGDGRGMQSYRRETNTMPNWAGSCWYYLRYLDPENGQAFVDPANEEYWMRPYAAPVAGAAQDVRDPGGVDLYVGGVEHAVLHLLYARFWQKVLFDLGHVVSEEPFRKYFGQGYIQAAAFQDERGVYVEASEVVESSVDGVPGFTWQGAPVRREFGKIGKSLKNMVSPDDMYQSYGADTFRLYEMGLGPLEQSKPWDTRAVVGSQRLLQRLWRNVIDEETGALVVTDDELDQPTARLLHRTIDAVGRDYSELGFNTAIARLTEFNNALTKMERTPRAAIEPLILMLAPMAPHICEELWSRLGHPQTLTYERFPIADPQLLIDESVTCVVQVKGKVRDRIEVPADITEDALRELALALPKVQSAVPDGIRTVIVRAPKLVNVVPL